MEFMGMKASVKFSREENQPNPLARLKVPFIFYGVPFQSRFSGSDMTDLRAELVTNFDNAPAFGLAYCPSNHQSPVTLSFHTSSSFPVSISAEFKPGSLLEHAPKISLSIKHRIGDFSQKSSIKIPFQENDQARLNFGEEEEEEAEDFSIRRMILPSNAAIYSGTTATSSVALFDGAADLKVHWGLSSPVVSGGRLWWSFLQATELPVSMKKISFKIQPKKKKKKEFVNKEKTSVKPSTP